MNQTHKVKINMIRRFVGGYKTQRCPKCETTYQTGCLVKASMPYCGGCGMIVLDGSQKFCCWCGGKFEGAADANTSKEGTT